VQINLEQIIQISFQLYKNNQYTKALALLDKAIGVSQSSADYWLIVALCSQKEKMFQKSGFAFKKALHLANNNSEIFGSYAGLLTELRFFKQAENYYKKAIAFAPDNVIHKHNLGLLYFRQNKLNDAISQFSTVLKNKHTFRRSVEFLIKCLVMRGNHDDIERALDILAENLTFDENDSVWLRMYSEILWLKKNMDWDHLYVQAIKDDKFSPKLLFDYINMLFQSEQVDKAERIFYEQFHNFNGYMPEEFIYLESMLAYQRGNADKAYDVLNAIKKEAQLQVSHIRLKSRIFLALRRFNEARELCEYLVSLPSVCQGDYALLASCYKFCGDLEKYRNLYDFDKLVKVIPIVLPDKFIDINLFNRALEEELNAKHQNFNHPLEQSLRHGSQTLGNLFNCDSDLINTLKQSLVLAIWSYLKHLDLQDAHPFNRNNVDEIDFSGAWSVKLSKHGFHKNHFHNDGWISGCYYVNVPTAIDSDGQGWIKFGQMESEETIDDIPDFLVKPVAGCIVLFPSYMWHGTNVFNDSSHRITVAFDVVPKRSVGL